MHFILVRWPALAVRHPWRVLGGAILIASALMGLNRAFGGDYVDSFAIPGTESQRAYNLLKERFPSAAGESAVVLL